MHTAMLTRIRFPRAHRREWARQHPNAMIGHGGLLSAGGLARWACDACMAPLDPDRPILVLGGAEGQSLCTRCALPHRHQPTADCRCPGCCQGEN